MEAFDRDIQNLILVSAVGFAFLIAAIVLVRALGKAHAVRQPGSVRQ